MCLQCGDTGLIPGSGRSSGVGNGNPFQYSCLENSMNKGAWKATVHGVTKSQTRLSTWHNTYTQNLEKWYWWTYLQGRNRDSDIGNRHGHSGGRRGWLALREQHWNVYTAICKTESQWKLDVWHREPKACALGQPRWIGWGGRWEQGFRGAGRRGCLWLICVDVWQKPSQYCKVIILQWKINKLLINKQNLPLHSVFLFRHELVFIPTPHEESSGKICRSECKEKGA